MCREVHAQVGRKEKGRLRGQLEALELQATALTLGVLAQ